MNFLTSNFLILTLASVLVGGVLHLGARWGRRAISQRPVPVPGVQGQVILLGIGALVTLGFSLLGWSFFTTGSVDVETDWDRTDGTITQFDIVTEAADRGFSFSGNVNEALFYVQLSYDYRVDGADYRGFQRVPDEQLFEGRWLQLEPDELDTVAAKYAVGSAVTVYYNPADPTEAALENDNRAPYEIFGGSVGGIMGLLTGIFALPILLYVFHNQHASGTES